MNRRLRNHGLTAAAFLVLVIVITVINIRPTDAQTTKFDNVRVVNTASDWVAPVPTQARGTTNVVGTIQAQQNGAWNVGISGTPTFNLAPGTSIGANVQVNNTEGNPVLVRDVNNRQSATLVLDDAAVFGNGGLGGGFFNHLGTVDVSDYSQIRVVVKADCPSGFGSNVAIRLIPVEGGQEIGQIDEITPCLPSGQKFVTRLIDLPGKILKVEAIQPAFSLPASLRVVIYGR